MTVDQFSELMTVLHSIDSSLIVLIAVGSAGLTAAVVSLFTR